MSNEEINPEVFQIIQSVLGDLNEEDTKILIESLKKETEEDNKKSFSEADLEGALRNDSLSDIEKDMLKKEEISFQESSKRRNKDNQLAHAIDMIEGLSVSFEKQ